VTTQSSTVIEVESLRKIFRYYDRECAEDAMRYVNGTRLDDRVIRTDWDAGFKEGRQFGRGKAGGQVCSIVIGLLLHKVLCNNKTLNDNLET